MKNKKLFWILAAVCAANFIGHLCVYPFLPQTIPIHWGFDDQADGWGPRWSVLTLAVLPLLMLLLLYFVPRIDPKSENYEKHKNIWNGFLLAITLFMVPVSWLSELAVFGLLPGGSSLVSVGCGVLFIVLGNYMPRIRQNYTFGCRTPWALADEHVWQRTQRMGGITFIVMGAAMIVAGLFSNLLGPGGSTVFLLAAIFGGTAWIYLYSYLVYCKKLK